jgi:hypothetical protein
MSFDVIPTTSLIGGIFLDRVKDLKSERIHSRPVSTQAVDLFPTRRPWDDSGQVGLTELPKGLGETLDKE